MEVNMFCTSCGQKLPDIGNISFCPKCGNKVIIENEEAQAVSFVIDASFDTPEKQPFAADGKQPKIQKQSKWIFAVFVFAIILAGIGFLWFVVPDTTVDDAVLARVDELFNHVQDNTPSSASYDVPTEQIQNDPAMYSEESTQVAPVANDSADTQLIIPDYILIRGVQFSTELTELELESTWWNVTPFNDLTNEDIVPLRYMLNLRSLLMRYNQINDLAPLANLTNLTRLDLGHNKIYDLIYLEGLTNLTFLDVASNYITDLTPLANLTNLTTLRLLNNQINDITPISGLTNLTYLSLGFNQINDLEHLTRLIDLETLGLSRNQISNVTPLEGLINLGSLELSENQIINITPLANLPRLWNLGLAYNQINDLTPLAELPRLSELDLRGNPITDWSPVAGEHIRVRRR